jgi:peptidyl-prolyl cis-trans isomerase B (cyclophilin B)
MLSGLEKRSGSTYTAEQRALYLKYGGTPFLDHDYTVFGQVVEGLDIIDKVAAVRTRQGDRPVEDVKMKITVE